MVALAAGGIAMGVVGLLFWFPDVEIHENTASHIALAFVVVGGALNLAMAIYDGIWKCRRTDKPRPYSY